MQTVKRETKQLQERFAKILTDAGVNIDDGNLLESLIKACPTVTGVPRPNVKEFRRMGDKSNERTMKIAKLAERMGDIGLTPILSDSEWKYVVGKLVEMEDKGWAWERFSAWYKSGNEYDRPKLFQIAKKPKMLISIYGEAFMQSETNITRNQDGSWNV